MSYLAIEIWAINTPPPYSKFRNDIHKLQLTILLFFT